MPLSKKKEAGTSPASPMNLILVPTDGGNGRRYWGAKQ
jgi:hypothetical protein